jgi:hypothetical protein
MPDSTFKHQFGPLWPELMLSFFSELFIFLHSLNMRTSLLPRTAAPFWRQRLLTALLLLLTSGSAWAMNPFRDFTIAPRQETYVPVSGGSTVAAVQTNEGISGALPLGFDFKFDGQSYSEVYASSNGFLSFSSSLTPNPSNDLGNVNFDHSPLFAALWDDLDGSGGTASYRTSGTAPSRVFTFEWRNWRWGVGATGANISFQARFYEGSNRIEYAYSRPGNAPVTGDGASIGLATSNGFAAVSDTSPAPHLDLDSTHNDLTTRPAEGQVYALSPPPPPTNDECANAALITVAPASNVCGNAYNTTNQYATVSGASIPNSCLSGPDTWYRFTAPASGNVRVKVTASGADMEVFSGTCGSLTSLDCGGNGNSNGNIVTGLTPGATHYLRVQVNQASINDPYSICVSSVDAAPAQPLTNDECAAAITLPVSAGACNPTTASLVGATPSTGIADPSCDRNPSDVWFRFTVPASGGVRVNTSNGPAVDGAGAVGLAVYSGTCGSLVEQGCNVYNGSAFYGTVGLSGRTPGEVLYARVWNYFGGSGSFDICVTDNTPSDLVVNSLNRSINGGTYRNVTVTSTGGGYLLNNLTVINSLTVQAGGSLDLQEFHAQGNGSFTVEAGGTLSLRNTAGISASGSTGAVQTAGSRSFSADADYIYRVGPGAITGSGLPTTVRNLFVNTDVDANFDAFIFPGPGELTLTTPLSVRQRVRLRRNLVTSNTNLLTLLSTPTQGSALIFNDVDGAPISSGGVVSGPTRVQRAIDGSRNSGLGYRHYSAPVMGSTVADLSTAGFVPAVNPAYNSSATPAAVTPFPTVFGYNEGRIAGSPATGYSEFDKGWESPASSSDALTVGRGYTVNIAASQVVDFVGTANSGVITTSLSRGTSAEAGWHLLGNPYPSPIDWSQASIPAGISAAMYVFESTGRYAGTYRSYINGIGNPEIPTAQGFFVRQVGAAGSSASFSFEDAMRETEFSASATTFRRTAAEQRPLVQLSLRGSAATALADQTTVYFDEQATAAVDARTDAHKLRNPGGQAPSLFSLAANAELAINGLALPTTATSLTVPLGLAVPAAGTYTISADQLLNLAPAGLSSVELLDRRNGQRTSLSQAGASYSFQLSANELTSLGRFALVFNAAAAPLATTGTSLAQQLGVYPNPAHGRFTLSVPALPGTGTVRASLRNGLGQEVLPARTLPLTATGAVADFDTNALAPGVYLLQLSAEGLAPVTKRVVVE